jgi:hypothetical protein
VKYTNSALENPLTQQFNQTHLQNPLREHKISQKNQISTTIKIKKKKSQNHKTLKNSQT